MRQIQIQLITACGKVYKIRIAHLDADAGRPETATENAVGQVRSCRHCGVVDSCVLYTVSCKYFLHAVAVINIIEFKSGKFGVYS